MTTTVTCEQCGKQFTAWHNRRFCDECSRLKNVEYMRRYIAAHRTDEAWQARHRAANNRYRKRKEAMKC